MKKNNDSIIYKVINNTNGKHYVGATTRNLETRKLEHLKDTERNSHYEFHQALATYGPDAFSWVEIDTAENLNELAMKERKYINKYNSRKYGYNGNNGGGFKKTIFQYEMENGKLIGSFDCLKKAADSIGSSKQDISRACLNVNNTYGGFYWSYSYQEPFTPREDRRKKNVYQLDIEMHWIATYSSVAEASRKTGFSKSCIARVCRGERDQSHGYIFKYE